MAVYKYLICSLFYKFSCKLGQPLLILSNLRKSFGQPSTTVFFYRANRIQFVSLKKLNDYWLNFLTG